MDKDSLGLRLDLGLCLGYSFILKSVVFLFVKLVTFFNIA